MTGSPPPPGWYPDPSSPQQLRWWTGERWTGAVRPLEVAEASPSESPGFAPSSGYDDPSVGVDDRSGAVDVDAAEHEGVGEATQAMPIMAAHRGDPYIPVAVADSWGDEEDEAVPAAGVAGWPKERKIAAGAFAALFLTPLLVWFVVGVVLTGGGPDAAGTAAEAPAPAGEEGQVEAPPNDEAEIADDLPQVEGETQTVDFDGVCEVEVDRSAMDDAALLRPWQFEECDRAPIDLGAGRERWIVVIASIDGETPEEDALARADGYGSRYGLLWSSHYPSLNPGWWVVYDGPFSAEDDAADAAEAAGGGSYPRVLSDDEEDRYCIADDGC